MAKNAVNLIENWSAQSLDLNIIKNIWCILQQRVLKRHPLIKDSNLWSEWLLQINIHPFPYTAFKSWRHLQLLSSRRWKLGNLSQPRSFFTSAPHHPKRRSEQKSDSSLEQNPTTNLDASLKLKERPSFSAHTDIWKIQKKIKQLQHSHHSCCFF